MQFNNEARIARLKDSFASWYGGGAEPLLLRAPGRVNLIGEHTDYNGYPVLPMAIDRSMRCAVRPRGDRVVRIANADERFQSRSFALEALEHSFEQGDWGNYVLAALRGVFEDAHLDFDAAHGFDAVFDGDVPVASGLSSSSALVVVSALAMLEANDAPVDRARLAATLAHAERHAGAEGGGMDQSVSLLAETGHALKIDFFPLRVQSVPLPEGYVFVVANSLVSAPKTAAVRLAYNRRVVEGRLAALLLAQPLGIDPFPEERPLRLSELTEEGGEAAIEALLARCEETLAGSPMPLGEIASRSGIAESDLILRYCTTKSDETIAAPHAGYSLLRRSRHVLSEALRVERAQNAMARGAMDEMGALMDASHASCRDDYEVSCGELEKLVAHAKRAGALGSRLTGAGFGGCTVSLVREAEAEAFLEKLREGFYAVREKALQASGLRLDEALFVARAVQGAGRIVAEQGSVERA